MRLVRHGRQGEEVVLHDARPGEFLAEASLDSARYRVTVGADGSITSLLDHRGLLTLERGAELRRERTEDMALVAAELHVEGLRARERRPVRQRVARMELDLRERAPRS